MERILRTVFFVSCHAFVNFLLVRYGFNPTAYWIGVTAYYVYNG